MSYVDVYMDELYKVIGGMDKAAMEKMVRLLMDLRERGGRLFFLGVGGGAGNASPMP